MQPDDFADLSPTLKRAAIVPAIVGYFHGICGHSPNPRPLVTHWPSRVDVADIPLTNTLVPSFTMVPSLMTSSIQRPDVHLLNTDYPKYLWLSIKNLTTHMREFITNKRDEKIGELIQGSATHIQLTNAPETFESLASRDKKTLMQIIDAEWNCPRDYSFNDTC